MPHKCHDRPPGAQKMTKGVDLLTVLEIKPESGASWYNEAGREGAANTDPTLTTTHPSDKEGHVMAVEQSTVEFRTLEAFPGYKFGSDGSVWGCQRSYGKGTVITDKWTKLAGAYKDGAYHRFVLCVGGKQRSVLVHRMILLAFVGPPPSVGMVAAHENGNPRDNRVCNLRWKTQKENIADQVRHGTRRFGESHQHAALTVSQVREIRRRHKGGESLRKLAAAFEVTKSCIEGVVTRRNWQHVLDNQEESCPMG